MRVLHVLDHSLPLQSGYAFRSAAIIREQRRLGWVTAQVTGPKHGDGPRETVDDATYDRVRYSTPLIGRMPLLNQADVVRALRRRLLAMVRDFHPDVIQAHSPCLNGLAALAAARRHGIPLVYEMRASWEDAAVSHGTTTEGSLRYRLSHMLETKVVRSADAVTTLCEGLRNDIHARGVPSTAITVIPNAVDLSQFGVSIEPDAGLRASLCPSASCVIGFFGSFYAYEGLDLLLQAMPALLERRPGTHLLLVGGGPEENRLRYMAESLGVSAAVHFTGRMAQQQIPAFYALADVLVYPRHRSRLTEIVTPLKPLEAMAQRKLVVASDVGGHRELVRDGETGFLFAADDAQSLVATVLAALDSTQRERICANARSFVETERTWPAVVAGYRPLFERLVDGQPRARPDGTATS